MRERKINVVYKKERTMNIFTKLFHNKNTQSKQTTEPSSLSSIPINVLAIADLHTTTYREIERIIEIEKEEDYDCVILLGDICREDAEKIAENADEPCFCVSGNHDKVGQYDGIRNLEDIDGKTVVVNGVRISGVSGSLRYKPGDFCMRTEDEVREVLSGIGNTDILVSHESPYHLMNPNKTHGGFLAISDFLKEKKPKVHLFGHHHEPYEEMRDDVYEICVYKVGIFRGGRW